MIDAYENKVISGHPAVDAVDETGRQYRITVCAECNSLRSVLFLTGDRWMCIHCRNEGVVPPERVHIDNPVRRSRNG